MATDAFRRAFERYRNAFRGVTRRARARFEACDWRGMQADARELRPDFWRSVQARILAGEVMDIFPYRRWRRLRLRPAAAGKEHVG